MERKMKFKAGVWTERRKVGLKSVLTHTPKPGSGTSGCKYHGLLNSLQDTCMVPLCWKVVDDGSVAGG